MSSRNNVDHLAHSDGLFGHGERHEHGENVDADDCTWHESVHARLPTRFISQVCRKPPAQNQAPSQQIQLIPCPHTLPAAISSQPSRKALSISASNAAASQSSLANSSGAVGPAASLSSLPDTAHKVSNSEVLCSWKNRWSTPCRSMSSGGPGGEHIERDVSESSTTM